MEDLLKERFKAPASPQVDKAAVDETLQSYKNTIDKQAEELSGLQAKIAELENALSAMVQQKDKIDNEHLLMDMSIENWRRRLKNQSWWARKGPHDIVATICNSGERARRSARMHGYAFVIHFIDLRYMV